MADFQSDISCQLNHQIVPESGNLKKGRISWIRYTYFMLVSRENLFNKISKIFPFSLSKEEPLKNLIEKSEVVFFESGNMVYLEGAAATSFYIIFEGEIEVLVEEDLSLRRINTLHEGGCFGEDALEKNKHRSSSSRALKNTLLIKIPTNLLDQFISNDPRIANAFSIISETYSNLLKFKFRDLSNETIYFIGKPHYFDFLTKSILSLFIMLIPASIEIILFVNKLLSGPVLIGVSFLLVTLFFLQIFWHFFEWQNDYYVLTGKRVINIIRHLINYESKFEIPLSAINNLEIRKNIIGRGLGFGDLVIRTYTGETILKSSPSASEIQAYLEYLMAEDKLIKKMEERKSFEDILNKKVFATTNSTGEKISTNSESFNSMENHNIFVRTIYHTHWIILLKRVLFPSLLLTSIILLLWFLYANTPSFLANNFVIIFIGFIFICTCLWWIYQFIDWDNDQYHITPDQVIDIYRKQFGTEDRRTASVLNIQSIRFERKGFLGLLLNFGTVFIRVGDEELTFDNVPDPAKIQEKLFSVLEISLDRIKMSDLTDQQQRMAEWIDTYHQAREKKLTDGEINN
jgi:CRP-like cAMP-binding protein